MRECATDLVHRERELVELVKQVFFFLEHKVLPYFGGQQDQDPLFLTGVEVLSEDWQWARAPKPQEENVDAFKRKHNLGR